MIRNLLSEPATIYPDDSVVLMRTYFCLFNTSVLVLLLFASSGCRQLRPKSEIDHLLSLIQRNQGQSRFDRTHRFEKQAKPDFSLDAPVEFKLSQASFPLSETELITGSGIENPKLGTPVFDPDKTLFEQPDAIRPKKLSTSLKTRPLNPLRPLLQKRPRKTLQQLVQDWSQPRQRVSKNQQDRQPIAKTQPNLLPEKLQLMSYLQPVPNCADPDCEDCVVGSDLLAAEDRSMPLSCNGCSAGNCSTECSKNESSEGIQPAANNNQLADVTIDPLTEWADSDNDDRDLYPAKKIASAYHKPAKLVTVEDADVEPWDQRLEHTIGVLSDELDRPVHGESHQVNVAKLRMLRLLSGNIVRASEPIETFSDIEHQCWMSQMAAVENMIALAEKDWSKSNERQRRRLVRNCLSQLRQAVMLLADAAPLTIRKSELCTEIRGYGQYKVASPDHLKSSSQLILYCEIENVSGKPKRQDEVDVFETNLLAEISIVDQQGQQVARFEYPPVVDFSRRIRRDNFVYFPFQIPNLNRGQYQVVAKLKDLNRDHLSATGECTLTIR